MSVYLPVSGLLGKIDSSSAVEDRARIVGILEAVAPRDHRSQRSFASVRKYVGAIDHSPPAHTPAGATGRP
jgi:hypothetical protein